VVLPRDPETTGIQFDRLDSITTNLHSIFRKNEDLFARFTIEERSMSNQFIKQALAESYLLEIEEKHRHLREEIDGVKRANRDARDKLEGEREEKKKSQKRFQEVLVERDRKKDELLEVEKRFNSFGFKNGEKGDPQRRGELPELKK